jgi:hypothetical protein
MLMKTSMLAEIVEILMASVKSQVIESKAVPETCCSQSKEEKE